MAGEWATVKLGDLCSFRAGSVFKPALQGQSSGKYPFVKVGDMNLPANAVRIQEANNWVSEDDLQELRAKPFPPGTVVFAKIGEALRQNRLRQVIRDTIVDNNMMGAVPNTHHVDPRFFYYGLSQFDFSEIAQGTALPYLTISALSGLELEVPPAHEQRAIAHILGTLDDKIELNRRMNETLEAMAQAIFKSWFVDFNPVRAKAEGRDTGLPKAIADLFPDSFEDSGLGEIPAGWNVVTVADVAEINARTLACTDSLDVIDYIEISEVMRGEIANIVQYERGTEPSRARRRLRHGDTVLSTVRPERGAHFLCLNPPETLIASTGFAVLSPRDRHWAFLYSALTHRAVGEKLGRLANGGAYPAVRPDAVSGLTLVAPTDPRLLLGFQKIVGSLYERAAQNRVESRTLATIRDTLLPKLISGELRIKDAEKVVEIHT